MELVLRKVWCETAATQWAIEVANFIVEHINLINEDIDLANTVNAFIDASTTAGPFSSTTEKREEYNGEIPVEEYRYYV